MKTKPVSEKISLYAIAGTLVLSSLSSPVLGAESETSAPVRTEGHPKDRPVTPSASTKASTKPLSKKEPFSSTRNSQVSVSSEEGSTIRDGNECANTALTRDQASSPSGRDAQGLPNGPIVVDFRTREFLELKRIARELGGNLIITIETRGIAPADLIIPLKNSGLFDVTTQDGRVFVVTSNVEAQKRRLEEEIEALSRRQAALLQNIGVLEKFREGHSPSDGKPENITPAATGSDSPAPREAIPSESSATEEPLAKAAP
ncbi:hypothetical protein [Candidatus Methylacidithermus pantelleriae]|uniref:Uncharacterized protein n=1 Tax=Candidatus Methylacidithermus pantelleriae TaxID=2744239 RepID=A0A8J2FPS8_9BACT|nr:hypothetical protein [Candidatus Methylacidithermus pantelleriae]CAF0704930.1 conserved exported hypothetical protein [Candidatus Methylacidithermus pantelleriae]